MKIEEKIALGARQVKFQAACSAAGPKLGGYTQWVRWRAPTEKYKNQRRRNKKDTRMAARESKNALLHC